MDYARILSEAITSIALKEVNSGGDIVSPDLLTLYDYVEDNDARAMATFTLVEQMELDEDERDSSWTWM